MTGAEERISTLETRVGQLETWAGPGQIQALITGMRGIRADMTVMRRVQDGHTRQLAELKTDMASMKADMATMKTDIATLKTDMAAMKTAVAEILRRLPERPASG